MTYQHRSFSAALGIILVLIAVAALAAIAGSLSLRPAKHVL